MAGFSSFKKRSKSNLEKMAGRMAETTKGGYSKKDERIFYPEVDKAKIGYAEIRFLPAKDPENDPWVDCYTHGFQDKSWYIEHCPTTIGGDCPVCEANRELWNEDTTESVAIARPRSRKRSWYSNILVINDPEHPENNGKVFIFRYGKVIFDKLAGAPNPQYPDDPRVFPFDLWEGATFKFKIGRKDDYANYDDSCFCEPSEIGLSDAALEEVYNSMYDLSEFVDPKLFKSYEDLEKSFERSQGVTNRQAKQKAAESSAPASNSRAEDDKPVERKPAPVEEPVKESQPVVHEAASTDDDADQIAFFEKLAAGGQ